MFGSGGGSPKPPPYVPPPPFQSAPEYKQAPAALPSIDFQSEVPQALSTQQVMDQSLGGGVNPDLSNYGSGWLSLKNAPTDQANMQGAERSYLANQGLPQLSQDQSNLEANGQGGSSYAGAYLGQETAMNNLNAFNAGLNQQQTDFSNVLGARNALYTQPIALTQQQNQLGVQRGLGIGALEEAQNLGLDQYQLANNQGFNAYNLSNNQGLNSYNLQGNLGRNQFDQGIFGSQVSRANAQTSAGASMFGSLAGLGGAYLGSLT